MAVNKVVYNTTDGEKVLIDLTDDSVTADSLIVGHTSHGANGEIITGANPYELKATNTEVQTQTDLITQIQAALKGKVSGASAELNAALNCMCFGTPEATVTLPSGYSAIRQYAFYGCTGLKGVVIPSDVTKVDAYAFYGCTGLTEVELPSGLTVLGQSAFYNCSGLTGTIVIPSGVKNILSSAFRGCSKLTVIDAIGITSIGASAFYSTSKLKALILRSTTAATLGSNAFNSSAVANGTGYIYVPSALLATYKAASGWSTYTNQIRALESYTVDGTIMGALDESKI